jgi:hypothetical protein
MRTLILAAFSLLLPIYPAMAQTASPGGATPPSPNSQQVEQWGMFEQAFQGPSDGNPFVDVQLSAVFQQGDHSVKVTGFYDGGGIYRIRFMPDKPGDWSFQTSSNKPELDGKTGGFTALAPSPGNHGPVHVQNTYHFAYADGTPYWEIGTTCYAWVHQGDELAEQTLQTLATAPFNKLRMCVFPKYMVYNHKEPVYYPYEGTPLMAWDYTRFNPVYFQNLEKRVGQLRDLGIEADIILFHPYDKNHWGFDQMGAENDDRYVRYVVARLSAYRNVWWSLSNEFDFVTSKKVTDWDRLGNLVESSDPYGHLRSIHNARAPYDASKSWITHVSLQSHNMTFAAALRKKYGKPVIYDECQYEGNIPESWGKLTAEEMVHRFWQATVEGAYCGHGETYKDPNEILWWAKGGVLHGQSPARIAFLKKILQDAPAEGLEPLLDARTAGKAGEYYLTYVEGQPTSYKLDLPPGVRFKADVIDTWNMTITPQGNDVDGSVEIPLPGKPFQAIRLVKDS